MEKEVHDFLESDLLDKYLIGSTTTSETRKVEVYIAKSQDVREEYEILQIQLELAARSNAINPPSHTLDAIVKAIDNQVVVQLHTQPKIPFWYSIAASITALIFAGSSYMFYNQNKSLLDENNTIVEEIFDLRGDIENNSDKLDKVMRELMRINNPETQKYIFRGNERAKDLKAVAYINPIEKSSLIDVISLPELSEEQSYQMWANLQDRMVSLGILDVNDRKLQSVPYIENTLSLSITIEPKGGNNKGSLENIVAQILLIKDN